jgi:hypothetical protein
LIDIEGIYKDEIKNIDAMSVNNDQLLVDEYGMFVPAKQLTPAAATDAWWIEEGVHAPATAYLI